VWSFRRLLERTLIFWKLWFGLNLLRQIIEPFLQGLCWSLIFMKLSWSPYEKETSFSWVILMVIYWIGRLIRNQDLTSYVFFLNLLVHTPKYYNFILFSKNSQPYLQNGTYHTHLINNGYHLVYCWTRRIYGHYWNELLFLKIWHRLSIHTCCCHLAAWSLSKLFPVFFHFIKWA
jgi:hypothetical protein